MHIIDTIQGAPLLVVNGVLGPLQMAKINGFSWG